MNESTTTTILLSRSRTGDSVRTRQENYGLMLAFDVNEFFSFGSPLSLVLAYRRLLTENGEFIFFSLDFTRLSLRFSKLVVRPCCGQLYNLFHACDPNASRIEPLIQTQFSQIPPCCIPRYSQFPLGDGESTSLGTSTRRIPYEIPLLLSSPSGICSSVFEIISSS